MAKFKMLLLLYVLFLAAAVQGQNRIGGIIGLNRAGISDKFIDYSPRQS